MTAPRDEQRERIIEALWNSGRHGCGLPECTDDVACPTCRADMGADADAVLAALAAHIFDPEYVGRQADGRIAAEAENERLKEALRLWQNFAIEAGSMYESTLRYKIPRIAAAARAALRSEEGSTDG